MNSVQIYPAFDALFYSYYVHGIIDFFGEANVDFSYDGFPYVPQKNLAFVVNGPQRTRVVIDAYDGARIADKRALEWCDIFGKVNLDSSLMPNNLINKCLAIGPSFSVRMWPSHKASWLAFKRYRFFDVASAREHFANYRRQYKYRLPIQHFVPGVSRDGYIFFSSSIWDEEEAENTNQYRAWFIESCRSLPNVTFEGGFIAPRSHARGAKYKEFIADQWFSHSEWLEKTRQSAVVFYTPSVWSSHSWKLAEFLALGKAIIGTAPFRELPAPLVDGKHIHYVDGSQSAFRNAIEILMRDRDYRLHLERNALKYYETYLAPKRVIERLLGHARDNYWLYQDPQHSFQDNS